jgi:hypothetical protein
VEPSQSLFRIVFLFLVTDDIELTARRSKILRDLLANSIIQVPFAVVLELEVEVEVADEAIQTLVF